MSPVRNFVNAYRKLAHLTTCLDPVEKWKNETFTFMKRNWDILHTEQNLHCFITKLGHLGLVKGTHIEHNFYAKNGNFSSILLGIQLIVKPGLVSYRQHVSFN